MTDTPTPQHLIHDKHGEIAPDAPWIIRTYA